MTRTPIGAGDTLIRISRDSSFFAFRASGGTVEMSPDVAAGVASAARTFGGILDRIAILLIVLAVIVFIPPIVMGVITITWTVQRRRHARA